MPTFTELSDFIHEQRDEPLRLKVRGTVYEFPGHRDDLPVTLGLALVEFDRLMESYREAMKAGEDVDPDVISQEKQDELNRLLVPGHIRQMMIDAGCTQREIDHVENTLYLQYVYGSEMARLHWEGKLKAATDSLGETLGQTGKSSTRTAPTGSTPTSTSRPAPKRKARPSGTPSKKRGSSSNPTSSRSTGSTSQK